VFSQLDDEIEAVGKDPEMADEIIPLYAKDTDLFPFQARNRRKFQF